MRRFTDRLAAGRELAALVETVVTRPYVVAAIPRGGVMVALPIAERAAAPLTVSYARKLATPSAPDDTFGAMDEDGQTILDPAAVARVTLHEIDEAKHRVRADVERRIAFYRTPVLAEMLHGEGVVLVDDGLASGLTMHAAIAYARRHGARDVTVAVPCASARAAHRCRALADHVVSLLVDADFAAIREYYDDFTGVSDEDVVGMLARAAEHVPGAASASGAR